MTWIKGNGRAGATIRYPRKEKHDHIFKINPAVLMGGVAGARSHSDPCREAAVEIQSSVPWIGFLVGYAVSGILLTVFGYFAMLLAQFCDAPGTVEAIPQLFLEKR